MNHRFNNITGVILVGGKSLRMGQDKAMLKLNGQPLAERIIQTLQTCFDHLLLVGDQPERFSAYGLPVVADRYPGSSLGGLYTGLYAAATERIFVASCDLPFPNQSLIRLICAEAGAYDAVVPVTQQGREPLFALYRKSALPAMQTALDSGNYRITDLLQRLQVKEIDQEQIRKIDPAGQALRNINTPDEYASCKELAS